MAFPTGRQAQRHDYEEAQLIPDPDYMSAPVKSGHPLAGRSQDNISRHRGAHRDATDLHSRTAAPEKRWYRAASKQLKPTDQ
jgi:hypothetical protein